METIEASQPIIDAVEILRDLAVIAANGTRSMASTSLLIGPLGRGGTERTAVVAGLAVVVAAAGVVTGVLVSRGQPEPLPGRPGAVLLVPGYGAQGGTVDALRHTFGPALPQSTITTTHRPRKAPITISPGRIVKLPPGPVQCRQ